MSAAHAVLVLAAGASRRLGQNKALLRQNGETLLRKTLRLGLATQPSALWLITGADADQLTTSIGELPVNCRHNLDWQSGIASSLQTGARALSQHAGNVLILVCDQPRLSGDHLTNVLALARQWPQHNIVSAYAGTFGVPALVTAATLQAAHQLTGDRGLKSLLLAQPAQLQHLAAGELAFDIDTPADLAVAVANGWLDAERDHTFTSN